MVGPLHIKGGIQEQQALQIAPIITICMSSTREAGNGIINTHIFSKYVHVS